MEKNDIKRRKLREIERERQDELELEEMLAGIGESAVDQCVDASEVETYVVPNSEELHGTFRESLLQKGRVDRALDEFSQAEHLMSELLSEEALRVIRATLEDASEANPLTIERAGGSERVIINNCYGSYGMSNRFLQELAEIKGGDFDEGCIILPDGQELYPEDLRMDQDALALLESRGLAYANTGSSRLNVVEIPQGMKYQIHEHDGGETIRPIVKFDERRLMK
ncbi:MAG: hypothetical protein ACOX0Z_01610 [Candidatus Nanosyncoccaceae bacterium]|jgi:hypothetical protein